MVYVSGMIGPVRTSEKSRYTRFAEASGEIFKRHGALALVDGWGEDVADGKVNDLKQAVQLKPDETVVFTYVIWPDKETSETGMIASMADLDHRMDDFNASMDGKRMIFGGFEPIVTFGDFSNAPFIDGFLLAVPTGNRESYRQMAEDAVPFFRKFGMISMFECWGVDVPVGTLTSMEIATLKKPDETVVFSWVGWPDKATRDKAFEDMQSDPDMKAPEVMPFDGSRMMFGGFTVIADT